MYIFCNDNEEKQFTILVYFRFFSVFCTKHLADFAANGTIITLNNITENNFPAGDIFTRYDDPVMICRQITDEIHTLKFREYI